MHRSFSRSRRQFLSAAVASGTLLLVPALHPQSAFALSNGLALTPPMGWNTYNAFSSDFDATVIMQIADAMVSSGLRDAGYQYLNLDGGWWDYSNNSQRNPDGTIPIDTTKFPNGMKPVADYVHSKGLKFGIYLQPNEQLFTASHVQTDVNMMVDWGVDFLKYDGWTTDSGDPSFAQMRDALAASGRSILYSINDSGSDSLPDIANMYRTGPDINDQWDSIVGNYMTNISHNSGYGPGGWNDPDMLVVGHNSTVTYNEQVAHFSLWAIMAAPLLLGFDLRTMTDQDRSIILNTEVIAVDQDPLGIQGSIVNDNGAGLQVISKSLQGGSRAVVLFNSSASSADITANWNDIGLSGTKSVRDLWAHADLGNFTGSYTANVAPHSVVLIKVS